MKIKNTSKKLISVDGIILMPGNEVTVTDAVAQTPAVQVLAKHGLLTVTTEKAPKQPSTPPKEDKKTSSTK